MSGTYTLGVRETGHSPVSRLQQYTLSACYPDFHEDQREKIGEMLNVSSLRYPENGHWCTLAKGALVHFVINRLPPLRELVLSRVPPGIRNGQLRRLERLRVFVVEDWDWLIGETTASLKCLRIEVGHHSLVDHTY